MPAPSSSAICNAYLLKVELLRIENPRITRTLSCPADATFEELHTAIQIAFGWADCHLHQFEVHPEASSWSPMLLRISPDAADDSDDDDPVPRKSTEDYKLQTYFETRRFRDQDLIYQYDFGDSWEHLITVLGRGDKVEFFFCVDGEGHRCAEDAGGPSGWEDVRDAYKKSSGDKDLREWYENTCANGDAAGLKGEKVWRWDQAEINGHLLGLREEE